ncbi:MAG: ABC transporter substrate-binding protein [Actinobacteria bacterium]|nr:MAG: ABC transporter substrate-binding protein [Actinomycetota bacterium]
MRGKRSILAALSAAALVGAACGGGGGGGGSGGPKVLQSIGPGEGQLNLVAWIGYTEDGSTDPKSDWVHPFEQQTGCKVNVKYGDTSDAMVNLMRQGGGTSYDGVSASGDATDRLIAHGDVAPINVNLIDGWKGFLPTLQSPPHNTKNGVHYGVSYMYGANILMYNKDKVSPAPSSWSVIFDSSSPYAGKGMAYGGAIYIADAALYLKTHRPELGITNPYELTQPQLNAAIDLLKQQKPLIKKYWTSATDEINLFTSGDAVVGAAWPYQVSILTTQKPPVPVDGIIPSEGATGWADTWMMSSHAQHPNCMYKWMQWASTPAVQAQVAEFYGATPSNTQSCAIIEKDLGADAAAPYHCGDDSFVKQLYLWRTPLADCGNGKNDCIDYSIWEQKFTEVIGG